MTLDHPYWHNMRLGAEDEAKKRGADITILNAKEDASLQIRQIRELIAKKVDIVCLVPMKKEPLVPGVQALNRAGIPVVVVNREIGDGCEYVCYVGTDTYGGAVTSAKILMEAIGGEGSIVEFHMQLGSGPELLRSKALRDVMKEYPGVDLLERLPTRGEESVVVASMQTVLGKYPDLKGVYTHDDTYTLAALKATEQAGREGIAFVGMNGCKKALAAIRAGRMTGSSYQQPDLEGRYAVELAVRYLDGEDLEARYPIECPGITIKNADQFEGQF